MLCGIRCRDYSQESLLGITHGDHSRFCESKPENTDFIIWPLVILFCLTEKCNDYSKVNRSSYPTFHQRFQHHSAIIFLSTNVQFLFVPLRPFFYAALAKRWKVQFRKGLRKFNNVDSKQHILMRTAVLCNGINSGQL